MATRALSSPHPAQPESVARRDAGASLGPSSSALWSSAAGPLFLLAAEEAASGDEPGYSKASYFTTLGLFLISFPGLYSLIKRSAKSKARPDPFIRPLSPAVVAQPYLPDGGGPQRTPHLPAPDLARAPHCHTQIDRKTFAMPGPAAPDGKPDDERARALFAFFKRNNYAAESMGDVISFKGNVLPERGTAAYITFCAFFGLGSAALVLSIAQPAIGDAAYWMCGLSPAAGAFYWVNAARQETMKVKMVTSDDDLVTEITVEGDANEIERCARELGMVEKGKVLVKGIFA